MIRDRKMDRICLGAISLAVLIAVGLIIGSFLFAPREENKKKKSRMGYGLIVLMVLISAAAVVLACTVFFRVETIEVTGGERYAPEEIIDAAGVPQGSYLILTPRDQVAQRIYKALPYVGEVKVKKHLPTVLELQITDDAAAAKITSGDAFWILDAKGKVLEEAQEGADYGCLQVDGLDLVAPTPTEQAKVLDENGEQLRGLIALMTTLQEQGMIGQITEINAGSKTEISMMYQGRLKVKFLLSADYERKIRIFREIVALIGEYETGTVDLKTERGCFTPTM